MIDLFVLRHAEAKNHASRDFERALTRVGERQARAVGSFCKAHGIMPDVILSSPFVRTRQTAEIVQAALATEVELSLTDTLACDANPQNLFTMLHELEAQLTRIMIVGHQPYLGEFIASALGSTKDCIEVKKASLTILKMFGCRAGAARLCLHLPPKLIP